MSGTITTIWGQVLPGWVGVIPLALALLVIIGLFVYAEGYYKGAEWMLDETRKRKCPKSGKEDKP